MHVIDRRCIGRSETTWTQEHRVWRENDSPRWSSRKEEGGKREDDKKRGRAM